MSEFDKRVGLADLVDALPQICFLTSPEGAAVWVNAAWREFTGAPESTLLGRGWFGFISASDVERIHAQFSGPAETWRQSAKLRRVDGEFRWFLLSGHPMHDERGVATGWSVVAMDETETRQARAEVAREGRRYRSLVEAVSTIVWRATSDGRMLGETSAWEEFTGQTAEQTAHLGWLDAVHPDDRETTIGAWREAVHARRLYRVEHRLRRHDGKWRHMLARGAPVIDDEGQILEWVGIHADDTERKEIEIELQRAKEAAEEANLAKSQFLANMSHELRTPLSAVIGYTELLEEEAQESGVDHMLGDLHKINEAARHLLAMISDVLDLSKIEANRMTVFAEPFAVDTLLKGVADTAEALIAKNGNALKLVPMGDLGEMHSDQVKLRQCLLNLLGNAAKFTKDGAVELRARRYERGGAPWLEFAVKDSGIGMSPSQLEHLFQRFVQADSSTTRRYGGSGLGLSITRAFVDLLGGEVAVESGEGAGSTFTISVPAELSEPSPTVLPQTEESSSAEKVLVIDDDPATRELIARCLAKEGFSVATAQNGREGLEKARALKPRVVLLDVFMPDTDGWHVLTEIRKDPELQETPVVMISFVREQGLAASLGANDYLTKPIEWDDLRKLLARYKGEPTGGDILVVDDDVSTRQGLTAMLNRSGFAVRWAANGEAALGMIEQARPAVILLDLVMPKMNGFAFLKRLRANRDWDAVRIVVLSAKDLTSSERAFLAEQADEVLSKGGTTYRELASRMRELGSIVDKPSDARPQSS